MLQKQQRATVTEFNCFIIFSLNFVTMIKEVAATLILMELSFLMLGTGVKESLKQMDNFTYPIHYIQTQRCRSKSIAWEALLITKGALFLYVSL